MTGLFFHNIARRWPNCLVYDPNGYLLEGMETIQLQDGGNTNDQQNFYTQQLAFIFEPIKNWTINVEGNMSRQNTQAVILPFMPMIFMETPMASAGIQRWQQALHR